MATSGKKPPDNRTARYTALLRGVNLGGKTKVEMAVVRELITAAGGEDVQTHLNSGNALFAAETMAAATKIAAAVENSLEAKYGRPVPIVLRSHAELGKVLELDPFPAANPSRVLVAFLPNAVPTSTISTLQEVESGRDEMVAHGREIYLHCPDGIADSKVALGASKPGGEVVSTARNWRTVTRLYELSAPTS